MLSFISYVPAGHGVHLSWPYAEMCPFAHSWQLLESSVVLVFMNCPASHAKQLGDPFSVEVKPAGQVLHVSFPD